MKQSEFPHAQVIREINPTVHIESYLDEILEQIKRTQVKGDRSTLFVDNNLTTAEKVALRELLESKGFTIQKQYSNNGFFIQW